MNLFANKKDLEAAQSQIESLSNDLTTAQNELSSEREITATHAQTIVDLNASVTKLTESVNSLSAELEQSTERINALNQEVIDANASAESRAVAMLAAAGHAKPLELEDREEIKAMTRAQFNALTPRQKTDFSKNGGKII